MRLVGRAAQSIGRDDDPVVDGAQYGAQDTDIGLAAGHDERVDGTPLQLRVKIVIIPW